MELRIQGKTLADFPNVAAQFDIGANGGVTPEQVPAGTPRRYWWSCQKGADHRWKARVQHRV
ncbi:zinc-ribbon domain-containing protein, partial [Lactococcus petauri]|uniref:zinc-ribbon domain-containing protein n=1 Tax=Lactococcus petauri TaxID=1940789 RepID=UPI0034DB2B71